MKIKINVLLHVSGPKDLYVMEFKLDQMDAHRIVINVISVLDVIGKMINVKKNIQQMHVKIQSILKIIYIQQ